MLSSNGSRVFIENKSSVTCYNLNTNTEQWEKYGANYKSGATKDGKVVKSTQNTQIGFSSNKGGNKVVSHNMGTNNIEIYQISLKTLIWKRVQTLTGLEQNVNTSGSYDFDFKGDNLVLYVTDHVDDQGDLYYYAYNTSTKVFDLKITINNISGITNQNSIRTVKINKNGTRFVIADTNGNEFSSINSNNNGVVKVYDVNTTNYSYSLNASLSSSEDSGLFGNAIGINDVGNRIVISEPLEHKHHVYDYESSSWSVPTGYTLSSFDASSSRFNNTIAINSIGDAIFIGEYDDNDVEKGLVFGYYLDASNVWQNYETLSGDFYDETDTNNMDQFSSSFSFTDNTNFGSLLSISSQGTKLLLGAQDLTNTSNNNNAVIIKDAKAASKTFTDLGLTGSQIIKLQLTPKELVNNSGLDISNLRQLGVNANTILSGGKNESDLFNSGFGLNDIVSASSDLSGLIQDPSNNVKSIDLLASADVATLLTKGITETNLLADISNTNDITNINFSQFKAANISATNLKGAGVDASTLKQSAYDATDLVGAGFNVGELKTAQLEAKELKGAGLVFNDLDGTYDTTELVNAEFADSDFTNAGYTIEPEKAINISIGNVTVNQEVKTVIKNTDISSLEVVLPNSDILSETFALNPTLTNIMKINATSSDVSFEPDIEPFDISNGPLVSTFDLPNLDTTKKYVLLEYDESGNVMNPQPIGYPVDLIYNNSINKFIATFTNLSMVAPQLSTVTGGLDNREDIKLWTVSPGYVRHNQVTNSKTIKIHFLTNSKIHNNLRNKIYNGVSNARRFIRVNGEYDDNGTWRDFTGDARDSHAVTTYHSYKMTGNSANKNRIKNEKYQALYDAIKYVGLSDPTIPVPESPSSSKIKSPEKPYEWDIFSITIEIKSSKADVKQRFHVLHGRKGGWGNSDIALGIKHVTNYGWYRPDFRFEYEPTVNSTPPEIVDWYISNSLFYSYGDNYYSNDINDIEIFFTTNKTLTEENCNIEAFSSQYSTITTSILDGGTVHSIISSIDKSQLSSADYATATITIPKSSIASGSTTNSSKYTFSYTIDVTPPICESITSTDVVKGNTTNLKTINLTFRFSENIRTLESSFFETTNSTLYRNLTKVSDSEYTGILVLNESLENQNTNVSIKLKENTIKDLAGNSNLEESELFIYSYDGIRPTIVINSNDIISNVDYYSQNATLNFTISEPLNTFTVNDINVNGACTLDDFTKINDTNYSVKVTPNSLTQSSTFDISIPENTLKDINNNDNFSSNIFTWKYDVSKPRMKIEPKTSGISSGSETRDAFIELYVICNNKDIETIDLDSFTVTRATVSNLVQDGDNPRKYIVRLTPLSNLQTSIKVKSYGITDITNNQNNLSSNTFYWRYSANNPIISIKSTDLDSASKSTNQSISIKIEISDLDIDLSSSHFDVSGGTLTNFTSELDYYTATFTATNPRVLNQLSIAENTVQNIDNDGNRASILNWTWDKIAPTMTITSSDISSGDYNNGGISESIKLRFTPNEDVTNFTKNDIILQNGSITNFEKVSGQIYYEATLRPSNTSLITNLEITAKVNKETFIDSYNTQNSEDSNTFIWNYNSVSPTVTLSSTNMNSGETNNKTKIVITMTFSKYVNPFQLSNNIVVTNGFAQNLIQISDTVYTCDVYTNSWDDLNSESILIITVNIPANNTITDNYNNKLAGSDDFVWNSNRVPIKEIQAASGEAESQTTWYSGDTVVIKTMNGNKPKISVNFYLNKYREEDINNNIFNLSYILIPNQNPSYIPHYIKEIKIKNDEKKITPRIYPNRVDFPSRYPPEKYSWEISIPKYNLIDEFGNTNINTIGPFIFHHDETKPELSFEVYDISGVDGYGRPAAGTTSITSGSTTNDDKIMVYIVSTKACRWNQTHNIKIANIKTENCSFSLNKRNGGNTGETFGWKSHADRGRILSIIVTPTDKNQECSIKLNAEILYDKKTSQWNEENEIPFKWTCDTDGPKITMTSPTINGNGEVTFTQDISINFSFDETPVSFTASDISLINCEIIPNTFSGSNKTYSVDVRSDVSGGFVKVLIPDDNTINDGAGNNSSSNSLSWNYTNIAPSLVSLISNDVSNNGFTKKTVNQLILSFDQEVVLTNSMLSRCLTGANIENLIYESDYDDSSLNTYTVNLVVDTKLGEEQAVTLSILPGVFYVLSDEGTKKYNNETYKYQYTYYNRTPKINITSTFSSGTTTNDDSIILNFQEINKKPVYDFDLSDIILQPDISTVYIDSFSSSSNNYDFSAVLHSSIDGQIRTIINPLKYKNIVDTFNSEGTSFTWNRETSPVTFNIISTTIDSNSSSDDSVLNLIIKTNKDVSKKQIEDNLNYTNVNPGSLNGTSPGKEFTLAATPILKNVQSNIYVEANSVLDEYGNTNPNDSDKFYWTFTGDNPTINLSSPSIPNGATSSSQEISMNLIINASETISFLQSYISLTNGTIKSGTFTQNSANNYSFVFRATNENLNCSIAVESGVFVDSFGVANLAPSPFNWVFNDSQPFITVTAGNLTSGSSYGNEFSTIDYTFTFSTAVTGFTQSDISASGGTLSNFRNQTQNLVWKALLTPNITNGNISVEIPAGSAQDKTTGSNSAASNLFTIGYDITSPDISFTTTDIEKGSSNTVSSITFNFTSNKNISTFDKSKIIHSNCTISGRQLTLTTYRVTVKPSGGLASISLSEGFAIDNFGNKSSETPENDIFTWTFDTTDVVFSLEENDNVLTDISGITTGNQVLNFTVTSNDESALLELDDISYENLTISNFLQDSNEPTIYTFTTTTINQGANKLFIPANVVQDGAGNPNIESDIFNWNWDSTPPIVTISSPDIANGGITNNSSITLHFDTNEPVLDFTKSVLSITNGSITNESLILVNSTRYKGTLLANGSKVTVTTVPDRFTDLVGVNNVEGNIFSYTYDSTSPSVVLNCVTNGVSKGSFHDKVGISMELGIDDLSLNLSESDLNVTNGTISNFAFNRNDTSKEIPEKIYSFDFISTNTTNDISRSVIFVPENIISDAAGNFNDKSQEFDWVYDARPLKIVDISSSDVVLNGRTKQSNIIINFVVSEKIFNLETGIFALTNCSIISLTNVDNDKLYQLSLSTASPNNCSIEFDSTINVTTGRMLSKQFEGNNLTFNWTFDNISPTMNIISNTQQSNVISNLDSIDISFIASKETTDFNLDSILIDGSASITNFGGSGTTYGGQLIPHTTGTIVVSVNAASFSDVIGNYVETDNSFTWIYDNTKPTLEISSNIASGTSSDDAYIDLSFIFSETIQEDFVNNYENMITLTNARLSNITGSGTEYTARLNPTAPDSLSKVVVLPNNFTDLASNQNDASSNEFTWTYTGEALTLTMESADVVNTGTYKNNSITVNLNASAAITSSFAAVHINTTNGTVSNLTNLDDTTDVSWQFTLTSNNAGQVTTATIPDNVLKNDLNNNLATSFSWTYDNTKPTIQISGKKIDNSVVNSGDSNNENFIYLDFTASENVTLTDSSINVTNGEISSFKGSGNTYSAKLRSNVNNGPVSVVVPVNSIFDIANNFNDQSSNTFIWNYDNVAPTITISSNDVSLNGFAGRDVSSVSIQITSDENISGLSLSSFTQKNCILSNLQGSNSSYSATLTTSDFSVDKSVEVFIGSNKITDIAGNKNTFASNTFAFTISAEIIKKIPSDEIEDLFNDDNDIPSDDKMDKTEIDIVLNTTVPDINEDLSLPEVLMNKNTNRKVFNMLLDQIFERSSRKKSKINKNKIPLTSRALTAVQNRTKLVVANSNQTVSYNSLSTNYTSEGIYVPLSQVNDFIEITLANNQEFKITQTSKNIFKLEKPNGTQQTFNLNTNPNEDSFTYLGYTFVFGSLTMTYDPPSEGESSSGGVTAASYIPCFMEGTQILTTNGYKNIENLIPHEDILLDDKNNELECLDIQQYIKPYNGIDFPHVVPKGACLSKKYTCTHDLYLTHNHAIYLPHLNKYYPSMRLKVPQDKTTIDKYVYYHVFTKNFFCDVIIANGIPCETHGKYVLETIQSLDNSGKLMKSILDKCEAENDGSRKRLTNKEFKSLTKKYMKKHKQKKKK